MSHARSITVGISPREARLAIYRDGQLPVTTTTSRDPSFGRIEYTQPRLCTGQDIDELIAELSANDPTLQRDIAHARPVIADILYDGQPVSLKILRLRAGLSQAQLAERCGMRQPHVSDIEAGKRVPTLDTARHLAQALGISLDTLAQALPTEGTAQ